MEAKNDTILNIFENRNIYTLQTLANNHCEQIGLKNHHCSCFLMLRVYESKLM